MIDSALQVLGREEEAERYARIGVKRAEQALLLHPENSKPAQLGAPTLARLGDRERAIDWLERTLFLDPDDLLVVYNAACTYAQLGETDKAFEALDRWAGNSAVIQETWLELDPDFDPIRNEPRFSILIQKVKDKRACVGVSSVS